MCDQKSPTHESNTNVTNTQKVRARRRPRSSTRHLPTCATTVPTALLVELRKLLRGTHPPLRRALGSDPY